MWKTRRGRDGWVAAGSITETAGRAAERATKGDENFSAAGKVLSARRPRKKSAENRRRNADIFEFNDVIPGELRHLIRERIFFTDTSIVPRDKI